MNCQKILSVCDICERIIDDNNDQTLKVWNKHDLASHGRCNYCNGQIEIYGHDEYIDMTEKYRRR
jgi:regulator of RNase E activity RraB